MNVTPLVGVWIEMCITERRNTPFVSSLPLWECGLKFNVVIRGAQRLIVTPLVGVWIEIWVVIPIVAATWVTPLVGVWIEIRKEEIM